MRREVEVAAETILGERRTARGVNMMTDNKSWVVLCCDADVYEGFIRMCTQQTVDCLRRSLISICFEDDVAGGGFEEAGTGADGTFPLRSEEAAARKQVNQGKHDHCMSSYSSIL